jgi:hypothetical protein
MDISGNLNDIMFQYNKNMRDYNDNMRLYLEIIANRERVYARNQTNYMYYTPPLRTNTTNSIFSSLFPSILRGSNVLQDVVVRPTQDQILAATEIISFDENASNNNTNCPITLEPFMHGERICKIKHCSHLFKQSALNDWFRRNVRCPVCRYDIRDYESDNDNDTDEENNENENDYSEMVEELLNENMENRRQNPTTQNSFSRNLTNAIRGFINNELTNLPSGLNNVASELLYTFDIPITIDVSGNLRI